MFFKTDGLVLRETAYRDSDKLLTVLTPGRGQLTLKARGVRSRSSPLKAACQLLAFSEFTVFENRGFLTVDEAEAKQLHAPLRADLELLSLASYFAQVAELVSQEDSPGPRLLALMLGSLEALGKRPQPLVKAAFELRAACLSGYLPDLSGCAFCGREDPEYFNVSSGLLECAACTGSGEGLRLPLRAGTLAAMRHISACDGRRLFSFRLGEESAAELSGLTETYLLTQLEHGFSTLDFYKSLMETRL